MGNTLSGSVSSFPLSLQSQTWLVHYTWDVVPETVGTHSCPRDVTEQLEALWGNQEGAQQSQNWLEPLVSSHWDL